MTAEALDYAAMYEVQNDEDHTRDLFAQAKLRWVADVIALDCRPTGEREPVIGLVDVNGTPWVEITAPVTRTPESTWPEGRPFKTAK